MKNKMNSCSVVIVLIVFFEFGCGQKQENRETPHVNRILSGAKVDTLQLKSKIQGLWEEKSNGVPYFFIKGDSIFYPHHDYEPNSYKLVMDTLMEKERTTGSIYKYVITKVQEDSLCIYNLNRDQQLKLHRRNIDDV